MHSIAIYHHALQPKRVTHRQTAHTQPNVAPLCFVLHAPEQYSVTNDTWGGHTTIPKKCTTLGWLKNVHISASRENAAMVCCVVNPAGIGCCRNCRHTPHAEMTAQLSGSNQGHYREALHDGTIPVLILVGCTP